MDVLKLSMLTACAVLLMYSMLVVHNHVSSRQAYGVVMASYGVLLGIVVSAVLMICSPVKY